MIRDTAYVFGGELEPRKPRDNAVYSVALEGTGACNYELLKSINAVAAPRPRVDAVSTVLDEKIYCLEVEAVSR